MQNNLNKLNSILLSGKAKTEFYRFYKQDQNFTNWLLDILPEVEHCELRPQNNPWHIYNVLDHTLVAVDAMQKQSKKYILEERRLLAFVMFLHDIGKPKCHSTRIDKNGNVIDSFHNHQIESEKIAHRTLPNFHFSETNTKIIEKLVREHDMFMFLSREQNLSFQTLVEKAQQNISIFDDLGNGNEINEMLCLVGFSDNLAQNPSLTPISIAFIKEYQKASFNVNKH